MAKQPELVSGLKQAMQRGESLGKAKQSFINAGYSQEDVEDSARALGGVISRIPAYKPQVSGQIKPTEKPKSSNTKTLIIVLVIILGILAAGLVVSFFFREKIAELLSGLF